MDIIKNQDYEIEIEELEDGMIIRARIISKEEMILNKNAPADVNTVEELELARKYIRRI